MSLPVTNNMIIHRATFYDLEKVLAICFMDQCLARLKQGFSLFPPRKLLTWAVNSSIAQSYYCISKTRLLLIPAKETPNVGSKQFDCPIILLHFKWRCLYPRSLSQWKFALVCFCSISQLNLLHFCLRFVFTFIFQGHMKVALSFSWVRSTSYYLILSFPPFLRLNYKGRAKSVNM